MVLKAGDLSKRTYGSVASCHGTYGHAMYLRTGGEPSVQVLTRVAAEISDRSKLEPRTSELPEDRARARARAGTRERGAGLGSRQKRASFPQTLDVFLIGSHRRY